MKKILVKLTSQRNFLVFCCLVLMMMQLLQILYFKRNFFLKPYDSVYWRDRYEHSQYQLPLSKRIIGDDGLYAYASYRLAQGDNPFSINVDKPPAGKYLIGFFINILNNASMAGLFLGLGILILDYGLSSLIFKEKRWRLLTVCLLFLDPLFFSQLWAAMLDGPQLFFLLLNGMFLLVLAWKNKYRGLMVFASGLALGFFAEAKPPILLPLILLLEVFFLWQRKLKRELGLYFLGMLAGIFLPYWRYIQLDHSLVDVLRVHKFMISFYRQSQLKVHPEAIWLTLFSGNFPNVVSRELIKIKEWWWLWPAMTIVGLARAIAVFFEKRETTVERGMAIFLTASLIVFTLVPSYPRYLLLLLPFFYFFLVKSLEILRRLWLRRILILIILGYGMVRSFTFLQSSPEETLQTFYYSLEHQYFQDIYQENLATFGRPTMSREEFRLAAQTPWEQAKIKSIVIDEKKREIATSGDRGRVWLTVTYKTWRLGSFEESKSLEMIKEKGEWKIIWNWEVIFEGFEPGLRVTTDIVSGKRGRIISRSGKILAQDTAGFLISVNPWQMDTNREQEMLSLIGRIGFVHPSGLQNTYLENALPDREIALVSTFLPLTGEEEEKLRSFPGVKLTSYPSRLYNGLDPNSISNEFDEECCTKIYSSYSYRGKFGVEKDYEGVLRGYDGGAILMKNKKGEVVREIIRKQKKDGQDVEVED